MQYPYCVGSPLLCFYTKTLRRRGRLKERNKRKGPVFWKKCAVADAKSWNGIISKIGFVSEAVAADVFRSRGSSENRGGGSECD